MKTHIDVMRLIDGSFAVCETCFSNTAPSSDYKPGLGFWFRVVSPIEYRGSDRLEAYAAAQKQSLIGPRKI